MQDLELLKAHIRRIEYAMLATRAPDGSIVSRPLQTMDVDDDAAIWFFTSSASDKVAQIRNAPDVDLSYSDVAGRIFISIAGRAELLVDRQKTTELWAVGQTIFFPGGADDPTLLLLKVEPRLARIWNGNESPVAVLRKFAGALLRGEAADLGSADDVELPAKR